MGGGLQQLGLDARAREAELQQKHDEPERFVAEREEVELEELEWESWRAGLEPSR
jgi:hypothetical protein